MGFAEVQKEAVNVTEETSDRLGRWFVRYGDDGAETFSARLLNASDGLEAAIKAGRFNGNLYAQSLARRLGGQWSVEAVKRPGSDVWGIIATRLGR